MKTTYVLLTWLVFFLPPAISCAHETHTPPFANSTILVIRHAEKPEEGTGLSKAGEKRAQEYINYFTPYTINGSVIKIDGLYATKDSKASFRPRLTLTPLSIAFGLPINTEYANKDVKKLVHALKSSAAGKTLIICWHHGQIPNLLEELGANSKALLPDGKWPGACFNWVIQLCYDKQGALVPDLTMRVIEDL